MSEQEADRGESLLLTSEFRANGFSVVTDGGSNTTLLKWGKPVAWFSAAVVSGQLIRVFLELIRECESGAKEDTQLGKPLQNGI